MPVTVEVRLDSVEGTLARLEEKVDGLSERVDNADWNGKGPAIKSLAEMAPHLIEMAKAHKASTELALARAKVEMADRQVREAQPTYKIAKYFNGIGRWFLPVAASAAISSLFWNAPAVIHWLTTR